VPLSLALSDAWGAINAAVADAEKYVILDLSACTITDNTIEGAENPSGNSFNVIQDNTYIKGIILPNTLTSIGESAFDGCTALTSIILPDTLESIRLYTFSDCTALTTVIFAEGSAITTEWNDNAFPDDSDGSTGTALWTLYSDTDTGGPGTYTRDNTEWTRN
jgi:hypothetical protein